MDKGELLWCRLGVWGRVDAQLSICLNGKFTTHMNEEVVVFNKELTRTFFFLMINYIFGHLMYFIHIDIIHMKILKSLSLI